MWECQSFIKKIKVIRFVGMGEPLLHPFISYLVRSAKRYGIADKVELLTNGVSLHPAKTWSLVNSGLDRLVISVQGGRDAKYIRADGKRFNFNTYLENIIDAYNQRMNIHIHIKGIDCNIDNEDEFYDTFSPYCDTIGIEKAGPIYEGVEMNETFKPDTNQYGVRQSDVHICPQPFTSLQLHPDGKVIPCYAIENKEYVGDCNEESLYDIWHGEKLRDFRLRMLEGRAKVNETCANCKIITHRMYPEDSLDNAVERLKEVYKCS